VTEAVVMAAGEGRRLRPLTERWAKPILPIDGRPVIATLLHELRAAGLRSITVVVGHLAEQVRALIGDGSSFGVAVAYAEQPEPDGSADAISRALAAGAAPPLVLTAADTVYTQGDLARFVEHAAKSDADGAIAVRRGHVPTPGKPGLRVEDGRIVVVHDLDPELELTSAPLWALRPALVPYLDGLPGPPWELRDAYQRAIDDGLAIASVEIGKTRDLTDPLDLVKQNFLYLESMT
jgi:dTDP-glucose pyrophosphorylase